MNQFPNNVVIELGTMWTGASKETFDGTFQLQHNWVFLRLVGTLATEL